MFRLFCKLTLLIYKLNQAACFADLAVGYFFSNFSHVLTKTKPGSVSVYNDYGSETLVLGYRYSLSLYVLGADARHHEDEAERVGRS